MYIPIEPPVLVRRQTVAPARFALCSADVGSAARSLSTQLGLATWNEMRMFRQSSKKSMGIRRDR